MTIRNKLRAALGVLFALIIGLVGLNFVTFERLQGDASAVNASGSLRMHAYQLAWLSSRLTSADESQAADIRKDMEAQLEAYDGLLRSMEEGDAAMHIPAPDANVRSQLDMVKPLWAAYRSDIRAVLDASSPAAQAAAEAKVAAETADYVAAVNTLVGVYDSDSREKIAVSKNIAVAVIVFALIIFGGASYIIITQILRPLAALTLSFNRVAGREGDLRQQLHADRDDEIGRIVYYFNTFIAKLREIMRETRDCSAEVSGLSENLWQASVENSKAVEYAAVAITNVAGNANQQNEDMQTLSASMTGMTAHISEMQQYVKGLDGGAQLSALHASVEATRAGAQCAAAVSEDIAKAADEIAGLTQDAAAAIEEQTASLQAFAATAEHLSGLAGKLDGLVGKFKV